MRRRDFITLLGGAAAWPHVARAQQRGKLPTVGFLGQSTRSAASEWAAAFVQRLRELGWIEGRNVTIEYRWGEGREERFAEVAAEFVRLKVDVIIASGTPAVMASRQATSVIPIVFAPAGDPVVSGLVASLARPGGNVTGLATLGIDLAGKRLELLREAVPGLGRLAIMGNVGNPYTVLELRELQARPTRSVSKSPRWKSDERRISRPRSRRSKAARTRFMSVPRGSQAPTGFESTPRRWASDCRRCTGIGSTSKREV
jgi:putative tryptophan/tyrosine transport system substrate-binding protein